MWKPPERKLHCPECGYDLRGQTIDRCPECGIEYDPDELWQEMRWRWATALAPFHTALPLLSGAACALLALVVIPDRIWERGGVFLIIFIWLGWKIVTHVLRGWIMSDILGEFRTGAGASLLAWWVDAVGTFPWWSDVLLVVSLVARYAGQRHSLFVADVMIAVGCALVLWGVLRGSSLRKRGQLEEMGDVERRLVWRARWLTISLAILNAPILLTAYR